MVGKDNKRVETKEGSEPKAGPSKVGVSTKSETTVITVTPDDLEKCLPLKKGMFIDMNRVEICRIVTLVYIVGNKCRLTQDQLKFFTGEGIYRKADQLIEMYDAPIELVKLTEEVIMTGSLDELFSGYCKRKVIVQICPPLGQVNTQWEDSAHLFMSRRGHQVISTYDPDLTTPEEIPDLGDDDDVSPDTKAAFILAQKKALGAKPTNNKETPSPSEPTRDNLVQNVPQLICQELEKSKRDTQQKSDFIDRDYIETELLKSKIIHMSHDAKRGTALYYLNVAIMADELFRRGIRHDSLDTLIEEQANNLLIEGVQESGNYDSNHTIPRGDLTGSEIVERVCNRLQTTDEFSEKLESILSLTKQTSNFLMSNQQYKFGDMAVSTTYVPAIPDEKMSVTFEGGDAGSGGQDSSEKGTFIMWDAFKNT